MTVRLGVQYRPSVSRDENEAVNLGAFERQGPCFDLDITDCILIRQSPTVRHTVRELLPRLYFLISRILKKIEKTRDPYRFG